MLVILVVFGVIMGVQRLLCSPFERKIREVQNTEEALVFRKQLRRLRTILFVVCLSVYFLIVLWINFGINELDTDTLYSSFLCICLGAVMLIYYLQQQKKYGEFIGNISTLNKREFLAHHNHYALFLRGFENDDYAKENELSNRKFFEKFSEYKFMEILQTKIPTCAIGMTKEADSPYGATRVYVDDISWKDDVRELMDKASSIYILVDDRPSCIWEIEQSKELLEKTFFIIEDKEKYENVRKCIVHENIFPEIPLSLSEVPHLSLCFDNGIFKFEPFDNTVEHYANYLQITIPDNDNRHRKGCLLGLGLLIILIMAISTIDKCERRKNSYQQLYDQYHSLTKNQNYETEMPIMYRVYTAEDKTCSIEAPSGMKHMPKEDGKKLSLINSSNSFFITVSYEKMNDLALLDINNSQEYAKAVYEFYKNDWETSGIELIEESDWSRGDYVSFSVSTRGEEVYYKVYTLTEKSHLVQVTFGMLSDSYEKYSQEIERMVNSFTFLVNSNE